MSIVVARPQAPATTIHKCFTIDNMTQHLGSQEMHRYILRQQCCSHDNLQHLTLAPCPEDNAEVLSEKLKGEEVLEVLALLPAALEGVLRCSAAFADSTLPCGTSLIYWTDQLHLNAAAFASKKPRC